MKPNCISRPNLNCALLLNVMWFQISKSDQSSRGLTWTRLDLKTGNYISRRWPQFIETCLCTHAQFQQVHSLGRCQRLAQNFPEFPFLKVGIFEVNIMAHHFAHCTILQSKCAKIIILEKIGWSKQIWISKNQTYSRKVKW